MTSPTFRWTTATILFALSVSGVHTALAAAPSSAYSLTFADEFSGSSLDSYKWTNTYPWETVKVNTANTYVSDGSVHLGSTRESWNGLEFSESAITTSGLYNFTCGYVEVSEKISNVRGSWPAIWMLGSGWPPEIDIMEAPQFVTNNDSTAYNTAYHYTNSSGVKADAPYLGFAYPGVDLSAAYHTYGLEWTTTALKFYFDGAVVKSTPLDNAQKQAISNLYLLLTNGNGSWAGTPTAEQWAAGTTCYADVDWVRIWQKTTTSGVLSWKGTSSNSTWTSTANWTGGVAATMSSQTASFGSVANSAITVDWSNSLTCAGLTFSGTTAYTLGGGNESLMLANVTSVAATSATPYGTTAYVTASGSKTQTINSRIDAYSSRIVFNASSTGTLALAGGITGSSSMIFSSGNFAIKGAASYLGTTSITGTTNVTLSGSGSLGNANAVTDVAPFVGDSGTVTFSSGATGVLSGSSIYLGRNAGGNAVINQLGGNVKATDNLYVGFFGKASYSLTNASGTCAALRLATATNASGTVNLNSGATLTTQGVYGGAGTSVFNCNGGVLKAAADSASFFQGITSVNYLAGGLSFDTNGHDVTITQSISNYTTGSGFFNKRGNGTLALNGENIFTGWTYVYGGTLKLGSSASLASKRITLFETSTLDVSEKTDYAIAPNQTLWGNGTVLGSLTVSGTVVAGNPFGALRTSDVAFASGSALWVAVTADSQGSLDCSGTIAIASGTQLAADFGEFSPTLCNHFDLMNFASVSGTFSSLSLPTLANGLVWNTKNLYVNGSISAVYEGITDVTKWNGADGADASDAASWACDALSATSTLSFDASGTTSNSVVFQSTQTVKGFVFTNATTSSYAVSGAKIVVAGTSAMTVCESNYDQVVANALRLDDSSIFAVAGPGKLTLSGSISGAGSVTKTGSGILVLASDSAQTGATLVQTGTLRLAAADGTMNVGAVVNDAALEIAQGTATVESVTGTGSTYVADGILVVGVLVQDSLILGGSAPTLVDTAATAPVPEPNAYLAVAIAAVMAYRFAKRPRK